MFQLSWTQEVSKVTRPVAGNDHAVDATRDAKMGSAHSGEWWGRAGRAEAQVLEAGLKVLRARVCGMVGDMKEESVVGGGAILLLPRRLVPVDKSVRKRGNESVG